MTWIVRRERESKRGRGASLFNRSSIRVSLRVGIAGVKQYWYFRYFIKVPNAGRRERRGRSGKGWKAVLQSYESRYRLLTGVERRRRGNTEASWVPAFVLSFRSRPPGKSSILMDELAIFNYWNGGQTVSGLAVYLRIVFHFGAK